MKNMRHIALMAAVLSVAAPVSKALASYATHATTNEIGGGEPSSDASTGAAPSAPITPAASVPAKSTTASVPVSPADSQAAGEVVNKFYGELTATMKQGDQLGFSGRYKKLQPVVTSAFNMPLMTKIAVGSAWDKATPDEQKQLISAFSDFSVANYASQFKNYNGESFSVVDVKPISDGVIVDTNLKPSTANAVALNYLMRKDDAGKWRIIDVFLDGSISQLTERRSEFSSIAKRDGIDALVNSLSEKSKQMGPS